MLSMFDDSEFLQRVMKDIGYFLQQDEALPHYMAHVNYRLDNCFRERWIGRGAFIAWPPRSPDLTPLNFF